eukprot:6491242-Amphidinium_carterae.1
MPWEEFAGGLHKQGSASGQTEVDRSALLANAHLPAWVHDYLDNPELSHVEHHVEHTPAVGSSSDAVIESGDEMDILESALDKAFKALHLEVAKRPEKERKVSLNFKVQVEQRAAGTTNHDSAFSAYQGIARTNEAKLFCQSLQLRRTAQFQIKTFGARHAYVCAHEWADIMDYLLEHWFFTGKSVDAYKSTPFQERFEVSVAMVKTLSCLSGKYKERALEDSVLLSTTSASQLLVVIASCPLNASKTIPFGAIRNGRRVACRHNCLNGYTVQDTLPQKSSLFFHVNRFFLGSKDHPSLPTHFFLNLRCIDLFLSILPLLCVQSAVEAGTPTDVVFN